MAIVTCPKCGQKNRVDDRAGSLQPVCGRCGAVLPAPGSADARVGDGADGKPITVTDASFERDVLRAGKPVLLDAWAAWCGPCRMIAPTIEQLAAESGGRYLVAKLNVDENPQVATHLHIQSIPTLFIFNRGKVVEQLVGLQPKPAIQAALQRVGSESAAV